MRSRQEVNSVLSAYKRDKRNSTRNSITPAYPANARSHAQGYCSMLVHQYVVNARNVQNCEDSGHSTTSGHLRYSWLSKTYTVLRSHSGLLALVRVRRTVR